MAMAASETTTTVAAVAQPVQCTVATVTRSADLQQQQQYYKQQPLLLQMPNHAPATAASLPAGGGFGPTGPSSLLVASSPNNNNNIPSLTPCPLTPIEDPLKSPFIETASIGQPQQPLVYYPAAAAPCNGLEGYFYPTSVSAAVAAAVDPFCQTATPFFHSMTDLSCKESPALASPSSTSSSSCSNYSMMMVPTQQQPHLAQQQQPHQQPHHLTASGGYYPTNNCGPTATAAATAEVRLRAYVRWTNRRVVPHYYRN